MEGLDWTIPAIDAAFWTRFWAIMVINLILSGDNAVIIAMAVNKLPPKQKKWGIILGSALAVVLRIILTGFAVVLLTIPFLKLIGGILILYIAVKLFAEGHEENVEASPSLMKAVWTILIADFIMSVDNVLAVAGAADGGMFLIIIGLVTSIPLVVFGSALLSALMNRFPIIITIGAAILGYVGADLILGDKIIVNLFHEGGPFANLNWGEIVIETKKIHGVMTEVATKEFKGFIAWPFKIFFMFAVIFAGKFLMKKGGGHKPESPGTA
jgi:YjbE family integral membrane protein